MSRNGIEDKDHGLPAEAVAAVASAWQQILRERHPDLVGLTVESGRCPGPTSGGRVSS